MKITDFLNTLATKCGKQNDKAIIDILARQDLANIDLADDVANAINGALLTVEGAKNNPGLKSHFTALALEAVDSEMLTTIDALGLGDSLKSEFAAEKNTFGNQRKLTAKIKEAMEALKTAKQDGDPKEIEKYTTQINALNLQIAQLKESSVAKSELDTLKKSHESEILDMLKTSLISDLNFANKDLPKEVNVLTAKTLLEKALSDKKIIVVKEGSELKLKRADDANLDYYDDQNKAVNFADFSNKIFADNKLLAVSGQGNPTPNNPTPASPQNIQGQQGQMNTTGF